MNISFKADINKDYCAVNEAVFYLKDGGTITIDRKKTIYHIFNGQIEMEWRDIYIWAINGEYVFDEEARPNEKIIDLLFGARLELVLEDDAEEDYQITNVIWYASENKTSICSTNGRQKTIK